MADDNRGGKVVDIERLREEFAGLSPMIYDLWIRFVPAM